MTVGRGTEWGRAAEPPDDLVTVRTDRELRRLIDEARRRGLPVPPVELRGGDLARTMGVPPVPPSSPSAWHALPFDLARASVDGTDHWFAAHLVVRRSWWRGPVVAVMNAQFLGTWDVAPRSHPNDGRLDVVEVAADMPLADRWRARRRLPLGTHLPHPAITQQRHERLAFDLVRAADVWLDGELVVRGRSFVVEVEPDAATAYMSIG